MAKNGRTPVIIGNWKMYKTILQAIEFIESLAAKLTPSQVRLFLAAPFTTLAGLKAKVQELHLPIVVGGQNMNDASEGAFTGEIAAAMLKEVGAEFVLLGHSERRQIFGEDDHFINKKVVRALQERLIPVLCVGESLQQREDKKTFEVVEGQLERGLVGVTAESALNMMIAYEPLWAIGTGRVAKAEEAQEVHAFCRKKIEALFGATVAQEIMILYGGSVKPENAEFLIAEEDIDGLLVGGASLEPELFYKIIAKCEQRL